MKNINKAVAIAAMSFPATSDILPLDGGGVQTGDKGNKRTGDIGNSFHDGSEWVFKTIEREVARVPPAVSR